MSIGNQEFGIPRKYQYQIGIWYLYLKFLGIFLVFYRNLEYDLVNILLNIGIFRQYKHRFGILFLWLPFHWYRFGFGFHFPESGISNTYTHIPASNTHFEQSGPAAAAA